MPYSKQVRCTNCGFKGGLLFPLGISIKEFPCPHCHTKSLVLNEQKPEEKSTEEEDWKPKTEE